jgi:hypothetical protein
MIARGLGISPNARNLSGNPDITLGALIGGDAMHSWNGASCAQVVGLRWAGPARFSPISFALVARTLFSHAADAYYFYTFAGCDPEKDVRTALLLYRGYTPNFLDPVAYPNMWLGGPVPLKQTIRALIASPLRVTRTCVAAAALDAAIAKEHKPNSQARMFVDNNTGHFETIVQDMVPAAQSRLQKAGLTNFFSSQGA